MYTMRELQHANVIILCYAVDSLVGNNMFACCLQVFFLLGMLEYSRRLVGGFFSSFFLYVVPGVYVLCFLRAEMSEIYTGI